MVKLSVLPMQLFVMRAKGMGLRAPINDKIGILWYILAFGQIQHICMWYLTELFILSGSEKGIHWCKSFRIVDENTQKRAKYFRYPTNVRSHPSESYAELVLTSTILDWLASFSSIVVDTWQLSTLKWLESVRQTSKRVDDRRLEL